MIRHSTLALPPFGSAVAFSLTFFLPPPSLLLANSHSKATIMRSTGTVGGTLPPFDEPHLLKNTHYFTILFTHSVSFGSFVCIENFLSLKDNAEPR
jgi:hypothetical protein